MEVIFSRLTIPVLAWILIALVGVVVSTMTFSLMRYEIRLHPLALQVAAVRNMKRHNQMAEAVRLGVQVMALLTGLSVVLGILPGIAVVWLLVAMNAASVLNSSNELWMTAGLVLRDRGQHPERHGTPPEEPLPEEAHADRR
jgi:hypothetical protein